jgi:Fe-Mn family superoxide dismutase
MEPIGRRELFGRTAQGAAALAIAPAFGPWLGGNAMQEGGAAVAAAWAGKHAPKPLPFEPAKLKGLSERLLQSHHANNYTGAVKRLNAIETELAALPKDAAPFRCGSLKREELIARNSMVLHEAYFGNLGGEGLGNGRLAELITRHYGSVAAWEHEFRLTGKALGGGSGWVVLGWDAHRGAAHTYWMFDHTHSPIATVPLLVMDMFEHAYAMDFGSDAAGYIEAFFKNLAGPELDRRAAACGAQ